MTGEFKQKMRLMYIDIWSMLRDFIVSEVIIFVSCNFGRIFLKFENLKIYLD